MKIGIVVASFGRPQILAQFLSMVERQSRLPEEIVLSVVSEQDLPTLDGFNLPIKLIFGNPGSCVQRNRGLDHLQERTDIVLFLDDDFWMSTSYLEVLSRIFLDPGIVCVTGYVLADGATTPGFSPADAEQMLSRHEASLPANNGFTIKEKPDAYGCNMAFRSASLNGIRFDERLPLYGWQEDVDFSAQTKAAGRIIWTDALWGVHLGTKTGKTSGRRFGYSQVINPFYVVSKGNMSLPRASRLVLNNMLANIRGCIIYEPHIDRRGRLWGNLRGLTHLAIGRIDPEYILKL
jgi:glycosyltransferase involved in cell wall biosynthesis